MDMGARSYVPQLGRFLQPDPRPGGSANAYAYTFGDPVNETDLTGEVAEGRLSAANLEDAIQMTNEAVAQRAAEEAAARAAAEAAARAAAAAAAASEAAYWASWDHTAGGEEWGEEEWYEEEWYEEEGGYEYASYHKGTDSGHEEGHVEPAVLYRPLGGEGAGEGASLLGSAIPLCKVGSEGPCADFEVWSEHVPGRVFRITCRVVAALAVGCGGDDFIQRFNESQRGPVETPIVRPVEDFDDPDDFVDPDLF
jgi:hypothetical protein